MSVAIKSPITMRKIGERKATNNAYKIAAATIATTATIAGLGIAAKTGKLDKFVEVAGDKKIVSSFAKNLKKAGDKICSIATDTLGTLKGILTKTKKTPTAKPIETVKIPQTFSYNPPKIQWTKPFIPNNLK